ncbi:unnamed protein product, partial [Musa hybrid cultivar]
LPFNGVVPVVVQRLEDGKQPVRDIGSTYNLGMHCLSRAIFLGVYEVHSCHNSLHGQLQQLLNYLLQLSSHSSEFFLVPYE